MSKTYNLVGGGGLNPTQTSPNPTMLGNEPELASIQIDGNKYRSPLVRANLLDNWYFVGGGDQHGGGQFPVNQKKQTVYTADKAYGCDRWQHGTSALNESIEADCLHLSTNSGQTATLRLAQAIENPSALYGKRATVSCLYKGDMRMSYNWDQTLSGHGSSADWTIYYVTFVIPDNFERIGFHLSNGKEAYVKAVKLELGKTQTLAHLENGVWVLNEIPDYTTQLLRCQRFYRVFRSNSTSIRYANAKNYRPEMRANPQTGSFTYSGTTYYYADANL